MRAWLVLLAACGSHPKYARDLPELTAEQLVARVAKHRDELTSWKVVDGDHATTLMTYWVGSERLKGDTLVMAKLGQKLRFAALSPAGGDPMISFACNGTGYALVNKQDNCVLVGTCDRAAIFELFHVALDPDDFIRLALGAPPLLADAKATERWDAEHGYERLELASAAGLQKLAIDTRGQRFDVVEAELDDPSGKVVWAVRHEFGDARDEAGGTRRIPTKSDFRTPAERADLHVEWGERLVNAAIPDARFVETPPAGVPACGRPAR
jgi:hypothetical protein